MFIIKHKTRRSSKKFYSGRPNEPFYFNVNGTWNTDNLEDACEVAFEAWRDEISATKQAPTLFEVYA